MGSLVRVHIERHDGSEVHTGTDIDLVGAGDNKNSICLSMGRFARTCDLSP
jgi:hypothetical protein